ncbi:unnamed protein product [Prunus brigantina]
MGKIQVTQVNEVSNRISLHRNASVSISSSKSSASTTACLGLLSHSLIAGFTICFSSASLSTTNKVNRFDFKFMRSGSSSFFCRNKSMNSAEVILSHSTSIEAEMRASPIKAAAIFLCFARDLGEVILQGLQNLEIQIRKEV